MLKGFELPNFTGCFQVTVVAVKGLSVGARGRATYRYHMLFLVRSNDSFNFPLGLIKYIVIVREKNER